MSTTELIPVAGGAVERKVLPVLWRDPHSVSKADLQRYISQLEQACLDHPKSPDLRTCLGMAYAMNLDVYKSMDALDVAREIDGRHFWAQMKYAELMFRLRALPKAEEETKKALELAGDGHELAVARRQLQEIRMLIRHGTQKPAWVKPLVPTAVMFVALIAVMFAAFIYGGVR